MINRPVLSHGEPLLKDLESHLESDLTGLRDAWLLKRGQVSPGQKEIPRLMDRYIECLTRLVAAAEKRIAA